MAENSIYGLPLAPLEEGWTPLEATAIIKCLDAKGNLVLAFESTDGLTQWEGLGMLEAAAADAKQTIVDDLTEEDDE